DFFCAPRADVHLRGPQWCYAHRSRAKPQKPTWSNIGRESLQLAPVSVGLDADRNNSPAKFSSGASRQLAVARASSQVSNSSAFHLRLSSSNSLGSGPDSSARHAKAANRPDTFLTFFGKRLTTDFSLRILIATDSNQPRWNAVMIGNAVV